MRTPDIFEMGLRYIFSGMIVAIVVSVIMLIWFATHRKNVKYTKKYCAKKIIISAIFVCYLIVVLEATMMDRLGVYGNTVRFQVFSSYREAWNSFSMIEWRNLLLNIGLFVPFGFLLPILSEKLKNNWITYLMGFSISTLIEISQLIFGIGVFEVDDILNNTLGTMIGFGVYALIATVARRKRKISYVITMQIPLILATVVMMGVFVAYHNQEFGNLRENYSYRVNMDNITLSGKNEFSSEEKKVPAYKLKMGTKEETLQVANELLKCVGSKVDESQNDVYDETIVYYSSDRTYSVWVDYKGLTTNYTNLGEFDIDGKTGCGEQEIKKELEKYNIEIPDTAVFEDLGNGRYQFLVDMYTEGNVLVNGIVSCTYNENNMISDIYNELITYQKYRDVNIISEEEAYNQLRAGKFRNWNVDCSKIEIGSVELSYAVDSKGYYQPVYMFQCKKDEYDGTITIPAMRR